MNNGYYKDPNTQQVIYIGNADLNNHLIQGKEFLGANLPPEYLNGQLPQGASGTNGAGVPGNWETDPITGLNKFVPLGGPEETVPVNSSQQKSDYQKNIDKQEQDVKNQGAQLKLSMDASSLAFINAIEGQYNALKKQQEQVNKGLEASLQQSLIQGGSQKYAQLSSANVAATQFSYGLNQIAEWEGKKQQAIAQAKLAQDQNNFKLLEFETENIQKFQEMKEKEMKLMADKMVEQNETLQKEQKEMANALAIDKAFQIQLADLGIDAMTAIQEGKLDPLKAFQDAVKGGAKITIDDISKVIKGIKENIPDIKSIKYGGIVGEWQDAIASGGVPKSTSLESYMTLKDPAQALQLKKLGLDIQKLQQELAPSAGYKLNGTAIEKALILGISALKFPTVAQQKDAKGIIADLIAQGDYEGAKDQLATYVLNSSGEAAQSVLIGKQATINALNDIDEAMDSYVAKGGNLNIFAGLSEKALEKVGTTLSGDLAMLANQIATAIIDYRRAVSGAAFTESEAKAYEAVFPSIGNTVELNKAKIAQLKKTMGSYYDQYLSSKIGKKNYDTIFGNTIETLPEAGSGDKDPLGIF